MKALRTVAQVDDALREMGALDATKAQVKRDLDQAIAAAKDEARKKLLTDTADGQLPLDDWRARLETAVAAYCEKNRAKLLDGDAKSRKLTHGAIGWRMGQDSIEALEGELDTVVEEFREKVLPKLIETLDGLKIHGVSASLFLQVDAAFNLSGLLQAIDQKRVSPAEVAKLGLQVRPAEDRFYCTPAKHTVAAAEKAA